MWLVPFGLVLLLGGCAYGDYRMPFEDGTQVLVFRDHVTHFSPANDMYDLEAQNTPAEIVAAAPGWVRFIDDSHAEPTELNNYVWIEHPYPFCPVEPDRSSWPGKPANYDSTCIECTRGFCNEWTIYAHMTKNSVRMNAGLSEGEWVEAGDLLGFENEVGSAYGVHLHWHVAVIPPDTTPTLNGYYQQYYEQTGIRPEVIPVVCHQDGQNVLWRNNTYTAAPCPLGSMLARRTFPQGGRDPQSPLAAAIQQIANVTGEGTSIALADPRLLLQTRKLFARLQPDLDNLIELGRTKISAAELKMLLDLLGQYERRGSDEMRRALQPIRAQLENPRQRTSLGILVEDSFLFD